MCRGGYPLCSRASTERSGALGAKVRDGKSKRRTPLRHSREASKLKTRMAFWSLCGLRGAGSATTEHGGCDDQWSDVSGGAVWPSIDLMRCKGSTASFPSLQPGIVAQDEADGGRAAAMQAMRHIALGAAQGGASTHDAAGGHGMRTCADVGDGATAQLLRWAGDLPLPPRGSARGDKGGGLEWRTSSTERKIQRLQCIYASLGRAIVALETETAGTETSEHKSVAAPTVAARALSAAGGTCTEPWRDEQSAKPSASSVSSNQPPPSLAAIDAECEVLLAKIEEGAANRLQSMMLEERAAGDSCAMTAVLVSV